MWKKDDNREGEKIAIGKCWQYMEKDLLETSSYTLIDGSNLSFEHKFANNVSPSQ